MSAYLRKIISDLNAKGRAAILATAAAEDGRVPYAVHDRTRDSLYGKQLLRRVPNRRGGFDWFVLSARGKRVAAELAERAAARAAKAEPTKADTELQYANAAQLLGALHPAAGEIVRAYQQNAINTVNEGGPYFAPSDVWQHIGNEPGQRLPANAHEDPEEWATAEGFNKTWAHLDRLAAAGKLDMARRDDIVTSARDVLRNHSGRPEPVIMDKAPGKWAVLFMRESPLTGEQWADMPVVSVLRTARLQAGHDWDVIDRRLDGAGLSRYGFTKAVSAGHALSLARKHWETHGPHAAWFRFLAEEAPFVETLREADGLTPEQEREAFAYARRITAGKGPDVRVGLLQAIAGAKA
ncbi:MULTISPECIES: hypothetical protein [unclassified Streptomyces]|uniref:hypothetical protein n=1 Tax=unclassified Streptomyces TaxID=2593676 RepID=UPI0035D6270A